MATQSRQAIARANAIDLAEKCSLTASVVVCAYTEDRWLTILSTVAAVQAQMAIGDQLLIIVDHNDGLLARCRESLADCLIIPNHHHRGLSGARNTAVDEAVGSIIIFIDDDAVPLDGWLNALRSPYGDQCIYGVGGLTTPVWHNGQPRWFPDEFLWVVGCSHRGLPTNSHPIRNLSGANMSFRRTTFDDLGGFAETMGRIGERPLGCEETEFSIRITQANPDAVLLYEPSARVEHHVAPQRSSLGYFARRCWAEGISKAEVSRRVGRSSALSMERQFVGQVLTKGIWRGIRDIAGGDVWGGARALVMLFGLVVTSAGYCAGSLLRSAGGGEK